MAQIVFDIPDAVLPRVINALAEHFHYQVTLDNGEPNLETKGAFVKRMIARLLKTLVIRQECIVAERTARATTTNNGETEIVIT